MATTAEDTGFPTEVWLGMKRGEWPIRAFITEQMAQRWAMEGGNGTGSERVRYVVGPVPVDPSMPARRAVRIPETVEWERTIR